MSQPINAAVARLINQANTAAAQGDYPQAQATAREAVVKANLSHHKPSQAAAHYTLATFLWGDETASVTEAQEHAAQALDLALRHADDYYLAMTLLARIEAGLGNFQKAQDLLDRLLDAYRRKDRQSGIADALRSYGDLALKMGDLTAAADYFAESAALYASTVDDPLNYAGLLLSMGSLAYRQGDVAQARTHWQTAADLAARHAIPQVATLARRSLDLTDDPSSTHDN